MLPADIWHNAQHGLKIHNIEWKHVNIEINDTTLHLILSYVILFNKILNAIQDFIINCGGAVTRSLKILRSSK